MYDTDYDNSNNRSSRRRTPARSTYERRAQRPTPGSTAQMRRIGEAEARSRTRGGDRTANGRARGERRDGSRPQGRDGRDPRGSAARTRNERPVRPRSSSREFSVPLKGAGIALLVSILITAVICVMVMRPQVDAARKELQAAQNEVATLTQRVDDLTAELSAAQSAATTSQSTKTTSTSSKATEATEATEGVEDPWVDAGRFTTGDTKLDKEVKKFCDENCSTADSREDAALSVYQALAWADYVERDNAQEPAGPDWRNTYAHQYFENDNSGNCYEFAAALMYCLQYMGYEDAVAEAILIQLQSGNWGDHGIVFVTNTDGSACMCDTARGVDGWMIDVDAYNYKIEDVTNN